MGWNTMGKTIVRLLAIISIIAMYNCRGSRTPKEFLYESNISRNNYQTDKLYFDSLFLKMVSQNIRPFHQTHIYDKNSIIDIDTVLYSPDLDKMVVFVIVKNNLNKFDSYKTDTSKYWYEGFFFFGIRNYKQGIIVNKNSNFSFESDTKDGIKESFYSYAFERKSTSHPFNGQQQYNMNDIRLWSSKQMEFEMKDTTNLIIIKNGDLLPSR
ncbi:MAG TPA: hypothetical protein VGK38_07390 [Prolixibacteraceae bacterium]|jgi:hypothetical protein